MEKNRYTVVCNYLFISKSFSPVAYSKLQYINFTPRNQKQNNYYTHGFTTLQVIILDILKLSLCY